MWPKNKEYLSGKPSIFCGFKAGGKMENYGDMGRKSPLLWSLVEVSAS